MMIDTDYRALLSAGQDGLPLNLPGAVVAIGNFDGVHLGHQALLKAACDEAKRRHSHMVVMTFTPHPRLHFNPDGPPFLLMDNTQKFEKLYELGATAILHMKFDALLASLTPVEFVRRILKEVMDTRHVFVGNNFTFGTKRSGNLETLTKLGAECGIAVTGLAQSMDITRQRYSSERVRDALRKGRISQAEDILGRPWEVRGEVVRGQRRGRIIGFPTANIALDRYVHPKFGVYTAEVTIEGHGDTRYPAIVNIGQKPTMGLHAPLVEAHLFDFNADLYGKFLRVAPIHFLRPEMVFMDVEGLKMQIANDVKAARGYFSFRAR